MFPDELPKRLIKMFSFPGETILDPFMESGTTASVAKRLNRNSVGYEINPDFIPIIKEKIGGQNLYDRTIINEIRQDEKIDFAEEIGKLPYQFIDTHKIDKKIDVKKLQFGSKIDANSTTNRDDFFTIKEVISPELLVLNNGLTVRLIGIKQNIKLNGKASEYLISKLKGKKVFLKYDEQKYDSENHLMVYLYLENSTVAIIF